MSRCYFIPYWFKAHQTIWCKLLCIYFSPNSVSNSFFREKKGDEMGLKWNGMHWMWSVGISTSVDWTNWKYHDISFCGWKHSKSVCSHSFGCSYISFVYFGAMLGIISQFVPVLIFTTPYFISIQNADLLSRIECRIFLG